MDRPLCLLLLCFVTVAVTNRTSQKRNARGTSTLRVMSYNIQTGISLDRVYDLNATSRVVTDHGVQLIGCQEVDFYNFRHYDDQPGILAQRTNMEYRFEKMRDFENGGYGILVMSSLPILDTRIHYYYNITPPSTDQHRQQQQHYDQQPSARRHPKAPLHNPNVPSDYSQGAVAIRVRPPGLSQDIWFVTTHLYSDTHNIIQYNEVIQLWSFLRTLKPPNIVLSGDFNSVPWTPTIRYVSSRMINLWDKYGSGSGLTYNSSIPTQRIDHLFVSTPDMAAVKIDCTDIEVPVTQASDHRPLLATLEFTDP